ncbi:hypothetical protein BU17DRAFT_97374 [Hysterangium stoloniferum]|nr:hypothetical protein BU17DRAFT_97374 [Hysterangium stoloniferum]
MSNKSETSLASTESDLARNAPFPWPLKGASFFASKEAGEYRAGPPGSGLIQIGRYTGGPVGVYDEIMYIPGEFDDPAGTTSPRITRIYVSTDVSLYNGRKHWNICKHIARFSFTNLEPEKPNSPIKIEVFSPSPSDIKPFFSAIVTPASYLPSFPYNSSHFARNLTFIHPPLPSGPLPEVGTKYWITCPSHLEGLARIVEYAPGGDDDGVQAGQYADGVGFPKLQPYPLGFHVQNMIFALSLGKVIDVEETT